MAAVALLACAPGASFAGTLSDSNAASSGVAIGIHEGVQHRPARCALDAELDDVSEGFSSEGGSERHVHALETRWEALARADLGQLAGLAGADVQMRAYWLAGEGLSTRALGNRFSVSGLEASPGVRVFDVWLEKRFTRQGISIRAGRLAADDEFMISRTAANFINGTFGWPAVAAQDLIDGGAAYPVPRPGVRVRYAPSPDRLLLAGLFEVSEPFGSRPSSGSDARGLLVLTEAQILHPSDSAVADTMFKVGVWSQAAVRGERDSYRAQVAAQRGTSFGFYAVLDRGLWHSTAGPETVESFVRAAVAPQSASPLGAYIDVGLGGSGLFSGRPRDFAGIAAAYGRITDLPGHEVGPQAGRARGHELGLELTYVMPVSARCALQPDLQYLQYEPSTTGRGSAHSALVLGVRVSSRIW